MHSGQTMNSRLKPGFIKQHKISAKKSLGQNFCIDNRLPLEFLEFLDIAEHHQVWEIGPGKGAITRHILKATDNVHLFEIDERLKDHLQKQFPATSITWGDFLHIPDDQLPQATDNLLVCGNLPYYCATPIIKKLIEVGPWAERIVFLLQDEVAKKAAAKENTKDYSFLSVHTSFFAEAITGTTYPPTSFSPAPKINSTVLCLKPLRLTTDEVKRRLKALKGISILFSQRRKMALPLLRKSITQVDWDQRFEALGIDPKARPENISPGTLLKLFAPEP